LWAIQDYPQETRENLKPAFAEAWAWLERECLIAPLPEAGGSLGFFITRRGRKLVDRNAYEAYRRATVLPRSLLHPRIDARVYPSFLRGAYDTAVFEALREVEISVREAAGFGPEKYGRFHKKSRGGLKKLLQAAKNAGLLRDAGFPSLKRRRENAAMIEQEIATVLGQTPESLAEEPYVDRVIAGLPEIRNKFAHPDMHTIIPAGMAVDSLIVAAEIINQLWPAPSQG